MLTYAETLSLKVVTLVDRQREAAEAAAAAAQVLTLLALLVPKYQY